jgi:hypothetical protein
MASISNTQNTKKTITPVVPVPPTQVDVNTKFKESQRTINKDRIAKYGIDPNKALTSDIAYLPKTEENGKSETVQNIKPPVAVDTLIEQGIKFEQGENIIGISPFDNYYMFSVFTEKDKQDVPLDLSNAGNLYLNFRSGTEEVRIQNYTQSTNADITQGQIIFKISKDEARKILSFTTNNFYLTAKKELEDRSSDETVLYTGKFYEYDTIYENTLKIEYEKYKITAQAQILQLQTQLSSLDQDYDSLYNEFTELKAINARLQAKLDEYNALIDKYKTYLSKDTINTLNVETEKTQLGSKIVPPTNPNVDPKTTIMNVNENTTVINDINLNKLRKPFSRTNYNTKTTEQ